MMPILVIQHIAQLTVVRIVSRQKFRALGNVSRCRLSPRSRRRVSRNQVCPRRMKRNRIAKETLQRNVVPAQNLYWIQVIYDCKRVQLVDARYYASIFDISQTTDM